MHVLFVSLSVPFILLGCAGLMLWMGLRRSASLDWNGRRELHVVTLFAPLVALGIGLSGLHDFLVQVCGLSEQVWYTLVIVALGLMALIAVGGLLFSGVRLMLMKRVMNRGLRPAPAALQAHANAIAIKLKAHPAQVLLRDEDQPMALTWGVRHPRLLLSTWMTANLDDDELQAVLAHELAHVQRRDFFFAWFSTLLRDAFFYLPASRAAHAHIKHDNELACDDLAARATGQPLALASALAKIWGHALGATTPALAQALLGARNANDIELRIERLIALSDGDLRQPAPRPVPGQARAVLWLGLAALLFINLLFMVSPLSCENTLAICR